MHETLIKLLYIAVGGSIGALLRYGMSGLVQHSAGATFPWGTLSVNALGSFLIGFFWELAERTTVSPNLRSLVFIGLLGAFTTFSTYSLESVNLLRDGEVKLATLNFFLSNLACIMLVIVGLIVARGTLKLLP